MNSGKFSYSILQYRHFPDIAEVINLGVLFLFPNENVVRFEVPAKLNRLTHLYPDIIDKDIHALLKSFQRIAEHIDGKLDHYRFDPESIIAEKFLVENGSSIHFSKPETTSIFIDLDFTVRHFSDVFLHGFKEKAVVEEKHKEDKQVARDWHNRVREYGNVISRLKPATPLRHDNYRITTHYQWENGTTNFIKAFSLDLATPEKIIDKSLLLSAQLDHLQHYIREKNIHLDLLVYEPSGTAAKPAINEALGILKNAPTDPSLYTNTDWEELIKEISDSGKELV